MKTINNITFIDREKIENNINNYINTQFDNQIFFSNIDIQIKEITHNIKPNTQINPKTICKYCYKKFSSYPSCNRHMNHYCKYKDQQNLDLQVIHNLHQLQ